MALEGGFCDRWVQESVLLETSFKLLLKVFVVFLDVQPSRNMAPNGIHSLRKKHSSK